MEESIDPATFIQLHKLPPSLPLYMSTSASVTVVVIGGWLVLDQVAKRRVEHLISEHRGPRGVSGGDIYECLWYISKW